jgi:serine/threonine-protein kinase PknK
MLGTLLASRYRVRSKLGEGGLGSAWRVHDEATRRELCLKLLSPGASRDRVAFLRALRSEFEVLRGLLHPHLARAHDFGVVRVGGPSSEPRGFMTSEIAEGAPLEQVAAGAPWAAIVGALAGPLSALAFLHRRGVRHGDFKPGNVLVDGAGRGTLIDLSCASRLTAPPSDTISGTQGFIAPELLRGRPADERADLFAVGVTLGVVARAAVGAPAAVETLVRRLTAERAADRPSSVGEVMDVLGVEARDPGADFGEASSLHGRRDMMEAWQRSLDALLRGEAGARVTLVKGPPGSGKTRLLRELKWMAETAAPTVEGFARAPGAVASLFARALGERGPSQGVIAAVRARDELCARGEATVLVFDDAGGPLPERDALGAFARMLEPSDPVLLLISCDADDAAIVDATAASARVWDLPPLAPDDVHAWLSEAGFEASSVPIVAACNGNAATIAEAVRRLRAGAPAVDVAAAARDAAPVSGGSGTLQVANIRELLPAAAGARRALAIVAASTGPVDPALLRAWTGVGAAEIPFVSLVDGGLVVSRRERAAELLDALGPEQAADAHRSLALHLERAGAEEPGSLRVADLAARRVAHLALAGDGAAAGRVFLEHAPLWAPAPRPWLQAAVTVASAPAASEEVVVEALGVVQRAGEPKRALELLAAKAPAFRSSAAGALMEGACLLETGDARGAAAAARRAATDAGAVPRARALAIEARAHVRLGAYAEALAVARRGLEAEPPPEVRAELHECAGVAAMYSEDHAAAADHLSRARSLGRGAADPRELVRLSSYEAILAFRQGDLSSARDAYARALEAAETHGVADQIARCSLNLGTACHQRGELAAALAAYTRGERLARALGQEDLLVVLGFDLAKLYADAGAIERADAKARQVRDQSAARGARFFVAAAESIIADVAFCRGDLAAARAGLERSRDAFQAEGAHREVAEEDLELCRVALHLGRIDEARRHLLAARAWSGISDARDLAPRSALLEARFAAVEGDRPRARRVLVEAAAAAERDGLPELGARAVAELADLLRADGKLEEAGAAAARARAVWSNMASGLPPAWLDAFWRRPERAAVRPSEDRAPSRSSHRPDARTNKLERLLSAFRKLNSSLETSDVLAMAMDEAVELTGAERGLLLLEPDDGGELAVAVARNVDRAALDTAHFRFSRSIAEQAIRTAEAVLTVDAQSDDRFRTNASVHAMRLRSVIAVPIRSPDGVLGALYLDNRYARARFDDADTDLLLAFADQVALALRNARLVEALRRRQGELDAERGRVEELARGQALEIVRLNEEVRMRQEVLEHRFDYSSIIGRAPSLQAVFSVLDRVIDSPLSVLVGGESGTGKELVARAVHYGSSRKAGPFVGINCAALPAALLESELFGHAKGAFTGADRDRPGLVVAARGGTLFLDELGELPPDMQAKLLRVLQEKEVRPVGSATTVAVDFRLVCATNRDLRAEVAAGRFREDLFYRIGVVEVRMPSLRERSSDLPELATHFAARAAQQLGKPVPRVTAGALRKLAQHAWPGNVRELENVITKAVVLSDGEEIRASDVDLGRADAARRGPRRTSGRAHGERAFIVAALEQTGWNAVRAARDLGMPRATFYRRLKALGLARPPKAASPP